MSIYYQHLKDVVIVPVISALGLNSPSAVNLLLGTAAQETQLGKYLVQKKIGAQGGIGIYQCEERTFQHVWKTKIENSYAMKARMRLMLGYEGRPDAIRMATDLMLATVIARLYYASFTEPLPDADDIHGLGEYYKKYWNTVMGKATVEEFMANYRRFIR